MFRDIISASLQQSAIPVCFTKMIIVSLPKITKVTGPNYYCPVTSTPTAMKYIEMLDMAHKQYYPQLFGPTTVHIQTGQACGLHHLPDTTFTWYT